MIDLEILKFGLSVVNLVAVIWLAMEGRGRVTKADLDHKLTSYGDRLTALERDLRHAPTHDDLKRIHSRLDNVCEDVASLAGEFKGKGHTLDLMQEYLLRERRS